MTVQDILHQDISKKNGFAEWDKRSIEKDVLKGNLFKRNTFHINIKGKVQTAQIESV